MFFFCNIHCVPCEFLGIEFEFAPINLPWPFVDWRIYEYLNPLLGNGVFCSEILSLFNGWMLLTTCRIQKSHRQRRSKNVEDDEEGHLVYHTGDKLKARCIEYFCNNFITDCFKGIVWESMGGRRK